MPTIPIASDRISIFLRLKEPDSSTLSNAPRAPPISAIELSKLCQNWLSWILYTQASVDCALFITPSVYPRKKAPVDTVSANLTILNTLRPELSLSDYFSCSMLCMSDK